MRRRVAASEMDGSQHRRRSFLLRAARMTVVRCSTARRGVIGVSTLVLSVLVTGCSGTVTGPVGSISPRPAVEADTAQRQMVAAVDDATAMLGGTWRARTGPVYPEDCELPSGAQGAQWRYLTGSTDAGTSDRDAAELTALWREDAMHVGQHTSSQGQELFARGGGDIDSISAYLYAGNTTVQAVSSCFPGDADRIAEDLTDDEP